MTSRNEHPQPRDLVLSGQRLHVRFGGAGPALLLLHSAWGDAEMSWSAVWNDLGRSFTIIAPDMPGFGASAALTKPSLASNANILKELLDEQKVDRAIVIGNSFGAAVAIEFAAAFPERTQRLVLVNGGYLPALPGFLRKLMTSRLLEQWFRTFMRTAAYSDKALAKAFPAPAKLPPGFLDRIGRNAEIHSRNVFNTFINQTKPQIRPSVPATIIWATGDRLTGMKQAEALWKWLGNAEFMTMVGAGHMPQVERPDVFVEAIRNVG
jgi:pimeloyl-ACP methyl ester carboxylesterase